ncbi:DUF4381 domain-containing protein [Rhizobium sp. KVB221]|uniref:DUF4381 domain-containing protein n=1 Tax=Rhizobium setariae TaxID=2801340 RepID=A0A936YNI2_9HYPH|nr:DUF4381 domain-containing protein [Rhizobium setariae]MBL0371531.1 DUF4381 domain-containing protein [Rhizobium setariae]
MATDGLVDSTTDAALKSLNDIVLPLPVSYMPQTWSWAALGAVLVALVALASWRWLRRWRANRYRREALAALEALGRQSMAQTATDRFGQQLAELLKRTALAAWPREEVAKLSGDDWAAFLAQHATSPHDEVLGPLVDDREYRPASQPSGEERARLIDAARKWIESHHVPA